MDAEILTKVIEFIAGQSGASVSRITPKTRLLEDLGIDGDDASEILIEFATRFKVDLGEFEFGRHFGPECGYMPFYSLFCWLFRVRRQKIEPVTIEDLVKAVENNAWIYSSSAA
jgi:acyl carrier protein